MWDMCRTDVELIGLSEADHPLRSSLLADVAQLVERHLAKVKVAGSIPVIRSTMTSVFHRGRRRFRAKSTTARHARAALMA